jgi:glycosyltransferase involved in cell wall biosynthesis
MRGSAHIRTQTDILLEEERRTGVALDRPSPWMVGREEREYQLADQIATLSRFAYRSFIDRGVPPQKMRLLPLGVNVAAFRPTPEVIEVRCRRLLAGEPLRVLYVGGLSFQKGLWDVRTLLACPGSQRFCVRLLGPKTPEVRSSSVADLFAAAEWSPQQPQASLPHWYAWGDVFLFPSLQDGFAVVLRQAHASGLPIVATTNCGGPEVVEEGETGWIVPIRRPEVILERLQWCDTHRQELADMVRRIYAQSSETRGRDWLQVAADFETLCSSPVVPAGV